MKAEQVELHLRLQHPSELGCLSAPCPHCGAASGEWCEDTFGRQHPGFDYTRTKATPEMETYYCIGHSHNSQCGVVFDSLRRSGLWLRDSDSGEWHRKAVPLSTAAGKHVHMWERYACKFEQDHYQAWYRGRYLGYIRHTDIFNFPTPFATESAQTLIAFSAE